MPPGHGSHGMTRYLISFGAHAMDHIPGEEGPDPELDEMLREADSRR
jgi:hypothetical protein